MELQNLFPLSLNSQIHSALSGAASFEEAVNNLLDMQSTLPEDKTSNRFEQSHQYMTMTAMDIASLLHQFTQKNATLGIEEITVDCDSY